MSNWWVCPPKILLPCPLRPNTFVPFADYDVSFKFPVVSSQVASPKANCCPEPTGTPAPVPTPWQLPPPMSWPVVIAPPPPVPPSVPYTLLTLSNGGQDPQIQPLTLNAGVFSFGTPTQLTGYASWYAVFGNRATGAVAVIASEPPLVVPLKYSSPSVAMGMRTTDYAIGGQSFVGRFSPDGQILAISTQAPPFMNVYGVVDGGLTHIPLVTGLSTYRSMWWSPDGLYMVVLDSVPRVYKRVGNVLTDITSTAGISPTGNPDYKGCFTPDNNYLILPGYAASAQLCVYTNNHNDTFTFVRNIPLTSYSSIRDMSFSSDGTLLFLAIDSAPRTMVLSHDGLGNLIELGSTANTVTTVGGQCLAVAITPDDSTVAFSCTAPPFLHMWTINKQVGPDSWVKLDLPVGITFDNDMRELTWM